MSSGPGPRPQPQPPMTPQQAKIIAAWEAQHPHCYVAASTHHVPHPHDPWRYIVHQADNDMVLGAVSRTKHVARHAFNNAMVAQLRDCLMTGRIPQALAQTAKATPLTSPEGTLTAHPSDGRPPNDGPPSDGTPSDVSQNPEPSETSETSPRRAPWVVTPLQERILAAWERLHDEFRVVAVEEHQPARFEPWKYRIERGVVVVGWVTKFKSTVLEPGCAVVIEQLRSALKFGRTPTGPSPGPAQRRDPVTGRIMPKLRPKTPEILAGPSQLVGEGEGWPKPWPTCGQTVKLTGEAARFFKYGAHPEDHTEFNGECRGRLARARKIMRTKTGTREELTDAARLANKMGDKESAHVLALLATKTRF